MSVSRILNFDIPIIFAEQSTTETMTTEGMTTKSTVNDEGYISFTNLTHLPPSATYLRRWIGSALVQ